jgi:hypothetical protein
MARTARAAALLALLLCLPDVPSASADYEETELRLKTAGVDEALRKKIHSAIDRGVEWLCKHQREDGGFEADAFAGMLSGTKKSSSPGYSALCALALRHAGTPRAMEAFSQARAYLLAEKSATLKHLQAHVYESGIAAMILMADRGDRALAQRFADGLVKGLSDWGWWGYGTIFDAGPMNLSTTQFGALGLWAARRAGAMVPPAAWRQVAAGHVRTQSPSGLWGYTIGTAGIEGPSDSSYPQGAFMGLANVLLAQAALGKDVPKSLGVSLAAARQRAIGALAVAVPRFLAAYERGDPEDPDLAIYHPHYCLYALEKACVFAQLEVIGGVPWYERGARAILAKQEQQGSWAPTTIGSVAPFEGRLDATAFALLFLLRSSSAYRPTTPRPVDAKPAGPVTPSEK